MTVEEVKVEKFQLEMGLAEAIDQFNKKTGCTVESVIIDYTVYTTVNIKLTL